MGFDVYISIEEKINGTWKKINTSNSINRNGGFNIIYSFKNLIENLGDSTIGYEKLPSDLTQETIDAMQYTSDFDDEEGVINLGDVRIIFWAMF